MTHDINVTGAAVHTLNRVVDGSIGIAVKTFSAQQALEIRARRDEYLAFAVHDLRSPLASLSLATSLLEREVGAEAGAEGKELLRIMHGAGRKLERLIQRVLKEDAAIRAEEEHRVDAAWVELPQMLQGLIEELQPLADHSRVDLRLECPAGLRGHLDEAWAELVFQNLISNAIRYSPGGRVVVSAQKGDAGIECSVIDNGAGIDPEKLPKIFESGETDSPAGFGLGLSIVQRLVKAHGGELRVESEPGLGASFFFMFPDPEAQSSL